MNRKCVSVCNTCVFESIVTTPKSVSSFEYGKTIRQHHSIIPVLNTISTAKIIIVPTHGPMMALYCLPETSFLFIIYISQHSREGIQYKLCQPGLKEA